MSRQRDWDKAKATTRPKRSLKDEKEWRENDAAARWLDKYSYLKSPDKK